MILSVLAIGTAGLGGSAAAQSADNGIVAPSDATNINVVAVDGQPIDPINSSNNADNAVPRIQNGDTVTIELNVTNTPNGASPETVNLTLTTDPNNPFSGGAGTFGVNGDDGVTVTDGGTNDTDSSTPDGTITVTVTATPASGSFASDTFLAVATSTADSDGNFQSGANPQDLDPAVRIDENGPEIRDPDTRVDPVAGTDGTDDGSPDLIDAKTVTANADGSNQIVHPGEQVRILAQVNQTDNAAIKNVSANVSGLGIANVSDGGGTPANDNVTMFRDVNGDGVITSADDEDDDGEFLDQVGPNGTYIGQFYVNTSAALANADVDVTAFEQQTVSPPSTSATSDDITVVDENQDVLEVHAQPGEDRVTVVFRQPVEGTPEPAGVATNSDGTGALSVEDFRYVDTNDLTGATSITDVKHEAGKSVAVLELDSELTERDVATLRSSDSEFDERHDAGVGAAEPSADMIRIESDQVFVGVNPVTDDSGNLNTAQQLFDGDNEAAGTDFTIFEANATGLELSPTEGPNGFGSGPERDVNPEEEFFVNATVTTAQDQVQDTSVSFQVRDRSGNIVQKDSTSAQLVNGLDVISFPSERETGSDGQGFTVTGGDRNLGAADVVGTEIDLRRFPPKGAADGPLAVSVQASGEFTAADNTSDVEYDEGEVVADTADPNFDGITVDAVRPIVLDATVQLSDSNADFRDDIEIVFSEPVIGEDGNAIDRRDLEYLNGDANDNVEIERVEHTAGDSRLTIVLNESLAQDRDLSADRIRVVPNQIVDAGGGDSTIPIGNPSREGLTTGTTDISIRDAAVASPGAVFGFPEPVRGDGSLIVSAREDDANSLPDGGVVTFLIEDADGDQVTKIVRDGVRYGGLGDITDGEDGVYTTRIFLADFPGGQADGEVTIRAAAGDFDSPSEFPANAAGPDTVNVDNEQPELTGFTPLGTADEDNRQAEVTFDEGLYGAPLATESLDERSFEYVDNSLTGASEIVDVDHTAGSDTVILTLNARTDSATLQEDRLRVVRGQFSEDEAGNIGIFGSTETGFTSTTPGDGGDGTPGDGGDGTPGDGGDGTPGDGGDGGDGTPGDGGDGDTFTEPLPGAGDGAQAPTDTDGDGQFEDVNGDGTADFDDAVALAFADTSQLSDQQRDALDFDGDGDVDFDDAIELAFST